MRSGRWRPHGPIFKASHLGSETFVIRTREDKDLGVVKGCFGMEGSSERRMTSGRSVVTEADLGKAGCGGG